MKIVGSRTEKAYREELVSSRKHLFESEEKSGLLKALLRDFPEMKTAYVLEWIPEQSEDTYHLLVNTDLVLLVEVDRLNSSGCPAIELVDFEAYKCNMSKTNRIKLAVAINLAKHDLGLE